MSCTVCHQIIAKTNQWYLIDGERGKIDIRELLSNLPFPVHVCSAHVCKTYLAKLKKREALKKQEDELLKEINTLTRLCEGHVNKTQEDNAETHSEYSVSKRFRPDFGITLSPIKTTSESSLETPVVPTAAQLQSTAVKQTRRSESDHYSATPVSVKVQWPSETRKRTLKKDLESLWKMLV
jgi:hypothetical protein